jgi:hypothetical protein
MLFKSRAEPTFKPPTGAQVNKGHALAAGLCGFWLFNEGGGLTVFDLMGYGNGTLGGSTGTPVFENAGQVTDLAFVAANTQKITISNNAMYLGGSFTISTLFQIASTGAANCIISKCNGNSGPFQCYGVSPTGDGAVFQFFLGSDSGFQNLAKVTGGAISATTWYYVHFTFDFNGGGGATATGTIYVNGVKNASGTGTASNYANDTQAILIGTRNDAGVVFGGKMAFMKIWNRPLSAAEVFYDYFQPYAMLNVRHRLVLPASSVVALNLALSDTISLSDNFPQPGATLPAKAFQDFISLSDQIKLSSQYFISLGDSLSLTDLVALVLSPIANLNLSDTLALSDVITVQLNSVFVALNINLSDSLALLDAFNTSSPQGILLVDSLNLSDSICVVLNSTLRSYIRRYLNDVV